VYEVIRMLRPWRVAGSVILAAVLMAGGAMAQSTSKSSSSASSVGGAAEVRLGGFVFETGARLAFEIVHEGDADCFKSKVVVERLRLVGADGAPVFEETYAPGVPAETWIGKVRLVDPSGAPLPMAGYEVVIATNVGSFVAEVEVAATSGLYGLGRYSAAASVCGYTLRVYRLISELDAGASLTLRVGDRLMIELEGNATTGYAWTNTIDVEYAVVREAQDVEYRAASSLIGAPGVFLFRYTAVDVGPQMLRFAYQRPWESVDPLKVVLFTVNVS
jgi:predicted secreted protein